MLGLISEGNKRRKKDSICQRGPKIGLGTMEKVMWSDEFRVTLLQGDGSMRVRRVGG